MSAAALAGKGKPREAESSSSWKSTLLMLRAKSPLYINPHGPDPATSTSVVPDALGGGRDGAARGGLWKGPGCAAHPALGRAGEGEGECCRPHQHGTHRPLPTCPAFCPLAQEALHRGPAAPASPGPNTGAQ